MIKKILSVLLCISVISSTVIFANNSENKVSDEAIRAFDILKSLDIIEQDKDIDNVDFKRNITRGDFAVYLARVLNFKDNISDSVYYHDVSRLHYAYDAITVLTENGYLLGDGNKRFLPENLITSEQVEILAVKALGLKEYINGGAYEKRVIDSVILESGIYDGVKLGETLDYENMLILFCNILLSDYYTIEKRNGQYIEYEKSDDSVLYKTRNMNYEEKLFVWASNGAAIDGSYPDVNLTMIGDLTLSSNSIDTYKYLGCYVDFIYLDDDGENILIWIEENKKSKVLELDIENKCEYKNISNEIVYHEKNKIKTVDIADNAAVIYNGSLVTENVSKAFDNEKYSVKLSSTTSSMNEYDIVIIESYKNAVVTGKDDSLNRVFADGVVGGISFEESDYDVFKVISTSGETLTYSDIVEDDVLSIFYSLDGKKLKIVVSRKSVSGTVDSIKNDNDDNTVTIDGKEYSIYSAENTGKIQPGTSVECLIDFKGYIVNYKTSYETNSQNIGYLISGHINEDDDCVNFKMFTSKGDIISIKSAEKLYINDIKYQGAELILEAFKGESGFESQLISYRLNADERIFRIYTAMPDDGNAYPLIQTGEIPKDLSSYWKGGFYDNSQGKLGLTMLANSSTKVFYVPENTSGANEYDYSIGSLVDDSGYLGAKAYKTSADGIYTEYVVAPQVMQYSIKATTAIYLVDSVNTIVNKDDDVVKVVTLLTENGEMQYEESEYVSLDEYNLKRGDAIQVSVNSRKEIQKLNVMCRANSMDSVRVEFEWPHNQGRTISCFAFEKNGDILKTGYESASEFDEIFKISNTKPILVYDSKEDRVYKGSMNDCLTYKEVGSEASKVIIQSTWSNISRVIVYR